MRLLGSIGFLTGCRVVALDMIRCMLCLLVQDVMVFNGTLACQGGGVKGCLGLVTWLVPFSILGLSFLMLGEVGFFVVGLQL